MKPRLNAVLTNAVHEGVTLGWKRAFKDEDSPDESTIIFTIHLQVMNSIRHYFDLDKE